MTAREQDKEAVRRRTELLARLREEHAPTVAEAQALLKAQKGVRKSLREALKREPQTVPQLAQAVGMPAHEVLWHVAAMKKYGEVVEAGLDEDYAYYLYRLSKEG